MGSVPWHSLWCTWCLCNSQKIRATHKYLSKRLQFCQWICLRIHSDLFLLVWFLGALGNGTAMPWELREILKLKSVWALVAIKPTEGKTTQVLCVLQRGNRKKINRVSQPQCAVGEKNEVTEENSGI